eukprot:8355448-Alexandrium_andersonii.AAC.1
MSASLVGSEMCIRDRSGGGRQPRPVRAGGSRGAAAPPPLKSVARGRDWRCLLYTSDAADDM